MYNIDTDSAYLASAYVLGGDNTLVLSIHVRAYHHDREPIFLDGSAFRNRQLGCPFTAVMAAYSLLLKIPSPFDIRSTFHLV
jgi:hypothetical protein